jgi:hypothetical protein
MLPPPPFPLHLKEGGKGGRGKRRREKPFYFDYYY